MRLFLYLFAANDNENNSNMSTSDNSAIGDASQSSETSPSTRQYTTITQSPIIKRKGPLKPDSTNVEVSEMHADNGEPLKERWKKPLWNLIGLWNMVIPFSMATRPRFF